MDRTQEESTRDPVCGMTVDSGGPYQLRHAVANRLRREFGLEMVRCLLGHSSASMTEVYAEVDLERARQAMESAG